MIYKKFGILIRYKKYVIVSSIQGPVRRDYHLYFHCYFHVS